MKVYVGVTGLSGTGKTTFAEFLTKLAEARGIDVWSFNLSDVVRRELMWRGQKDEVISRRTLIDVANELRASHGPKVLAERIILQDNQSSSSSRTPELVIVAGIRSSDEVEAFRNAWGLYFVLVALEATPETRSDRMSKRRQYFEDVEPLMTVEYADQAIGIPACVNLSDYTISNDGSIDQLWLAAETFFFDVVDSLLRTS